MSSEDKRWLSSPKLEGVKWLWADDWYDGMLSGVVEYQGKKYYGFFVDENRKPGGWFRRYICIDLPEDVWKEELERHAFFVEKVGEHWEFADDMKRKGSFVERGTSHEFYERYPPDKRPAYRDYPYIGWFEE